MDSEICYTWNCEKDEQLQRERGLSFDAVLAAIREDKVLADFPHENALRYANQRILVVEIEGYACPVPDVRDGNTIFFKTIYKGRILQRRYRDRIKQ